MTNTARCALAIFAALGIAGAIVGWMETRRPVAQKTPVQASSDSAVRLDDAQKGFDSSLKRFNNTLDNYLKAEPQSKTTMICYMVDKDGNLERRDVGNPGWNTEESAGVILNTHPTLIWTKCEMVSRLADAPKGER